MNSEEISQVNKFKNKKEERIYTGKEQLRRHHRGRIIKAETIFLTLY